MEHLLDYLLDFLKLNVRIILLSKLDTMMESACLSSKLLGNDGLPKMAIIHLGVPICKSCFDWTVTVGQQSRAKITSFSVFIFSKFIWEAFFF